jgi:F-type H+-transporting ATPase subunit b
MIDWYTVGFALFNFLVLIFLLRWLLYGPIIRAMDEREAEISRRQAEAAEKAVAAEEEARNYRQKTAELREREGELLDGARAAAEAERRTLAEAARREMDEVQKRWQEAFFRQKESFVIELRRQMARQASRIARRCLRDLADADLERLIWRVFMEKLAHLAPEELERLRPAAAPGENIIVRGAFEPSAEMLEQLAERLASLLPGAAPLRYEAAPELICGVELEAGGSRIAWTIESYLDGLEEQILLTVERQAKEAAGGA